MMPHLAEIYDAAFFREWGPKNAPYVESARRVADTILELFRPSSVADIGCGCGVYSRHFLDKGLRVLALDGVLAPEEDRFPVPVVLRDLTAPFPNEWGRFDATVCLEVAEHIPEEFLSPFLDNILQFSDRLFLSAAPPFQGGHHHVNERPRRYWVAALAEKGFAYNRKATGRLAEGFNKNKLPFMWMGRHIAVFERLTNGHGEPALPFGIRLDRQKVPGA